MNIQDRSRRTLLEPVAGFALVLIAAYFTICGPLCAQSSDKQPSDADKSWTTTTESNNAGVNPTRTVQSHTQSGNRTVDTKSIERRDADGHFSPYIDIETETVQVDRNTVRTVTRSFARDSNGEKKLVQVTEEQQSSLPGGNSKVERTTSNSDIDGNLSVVQREVEETKKIGENAEETQKTVMMQGINGMAPVMKTKERRTHTGKDTVESQTTTMLPDGSGNWQVGEVRQSTTRTGEKPQKEETVSRPDSEGNMKEVSRSVSTQSADASGEKHETVESYSLDVPGTTRDGSLHLVERSSTAQRTNPGGQQITQQQVEQTNPGDPAAGLRVTVISTNAVRPGTGEAQSTQTVQTRDANGNFGTVSVDLSKSDNIHTIEVKIGPPQ